VVSLIRFLDYNRIKVRVLRQVLRLLLQVLQVRGLTVML
jgi:hypothetical protein